MLASKYETCLLFNDQQKNLGSPCGQVHFKDKLSKVLPSDAELSDSLTAYFKSLRLDTTLNRIIEQEMNGVKKITHESIWKNLSYSQKRWQLFTVLYEEAIDFVSMDTLCIAISLLDRCYSRKPSIPSKAFKIYAIGSLFVACKLTSDYTVAKKSFCKQLAPSLSIRELEKYEKIVLSLLSYDIYVLSLPSVESYLTPLIFQHWFFKTLSEEDSEQMMCEWQYMLVEIMKDCRFTAFRPSEIICASLWMILDVMWPSRFTITSFFYLCTSMDIEGEKENELKYLKRFNDCIELIYKKLPSFSH